MPTARFQPSFAAGVLGPGLHGRIDIAKYDVALKVGLNVFVHAHGGVSNRAGLEFITEVMDSTKVHRLLPVESLRHGAFDKRFHKLGDRRQLLLANRFNAGIRIG